MNKKWIEFYPEFSVTYKIRANLTEVEFTQLEKLRNSFDDFYPFAANLNQLILDSKFVNAIFTNLQTSIITYYKTTQNYFENLDLVISTYSAILEQNKNLTLTSDNENSFMSSQYIFKEEILSFQNEFVQVIQYIKRFMNYVMKKIKETDTKLNKSKSDLKLYILKLNEYINRIKNQKEKLYENILE